MAKRKYRFVAMLIEIAEKDKGTAEKPRIVDEYAFSAVSIQGAKRAASEWYNRLYPDFFDRLPNNVQPGSAWDWRFVEDFERNRHFRITPSGLALVLVPAGSQETDDDVERMASLMAEVRRDPQAARRKYGASKLTEWLERYFRYAVDEVGGEIAEQVRRDADMVYDWPGAPAMLSRALDCRPGELRKLLGRLRNLRCPKCGRTSVVLDERRKGGFAVKTYYCVPCGVDLVEYQASGLRHDRRDSEDES
jgi:hypothetical protein